MAQLFCACLAIKQADVISAKGQESAHATMALPFLQHKYSMRVVTKFIEITKTMAPEKEMRHAQIGQMIPSQVVLTAMEQVYVQDRQRQGPDRK
jgi:hypothetical protein